MHDPLNIYRGRYKDFIEDIMKKRPINEYFEHSSCHHVIPLCCEGTEDTEDNIKLYLTHKEHFIAHKILSEENPDNHRLIYAYWRMCNGRVTQATPEEYEEARIKHAKASSLDNSGENHPWYGKHLPLETREKISKALKCRELSEEHKTNLSNSCKGRILSDVTKEKISKSLIGREISEETRRKMSDSQKGEKGYWYGKTPSEETRKKISEAVSGERHPSYGKHLSKEIRDKISESSRGKVLSEETKKKISASCSGKKYPNRKYHLICKSCGNEFLGTGSKQKYCMTCKEV